VRKDINEFNRNQSWKISNIKKMRDCEVCEPPLIK